MRIESRKVLGVSGLDGHFSVSGWMNSFGAFENSMWDLVSMQCQSDFRGLFGIIWKTSMSTRHSHATTIDSHSNCALPDRVRPRNAPGRLAVASMSNIRSNTVHIKQKHTCHTNPSCARSGARLGRRRRFDSTETPEVDDGGHGLQHVMNESHTRKKHKPSQDSSVA